MTTTVLIANRGEIAVRIIRTARELGLTTVAVHPADDAGSEHAVLADQTAVLPGRGAAAYLDSTAVIEAAHAHGARFVHPGYGFLAESPDFAEACAAVGLTFIGPNVEALRIAGDKAATRDLAARLDIRIPAAIGVIESPDDARTLLEANSSGIMLKSLAGGGGRGISLVTDVAVLDDAFRRCSSEAEMGFGDARLTAEAYYPGARHIEVQCVGTPDGTIAFGDRDCSLQRRRQKVVEAAPAPSLESDRRRALWDAAERLLDSLDYRSLATVEFLVTPDDWVLIEVNPRIQVEHTITEMVTNLDLVALQFAVARGLDVSDFGLTADRERNLVDRGAAIQARIAAEHYTADGLLQASSGEITGFDMPSGPGIRVDTWVRAGTTVSTSYDSLIAKLCVYSDLGTAAAQQKLVAALDELTITGIPTSIPFVRSLLDVATVGDSTTETVDQLTPQILQRVKKLEDASPTRSHADSNGPTSIRNAGGSMQRGASEPTLEPDEEPVLSPLSGTIVSLVSEGEQLDINEIGLIEAMKMHHPIAVASGVSNIRYFAAVGDTVSAGDVIAAVRLDSSATSQDVSIQGEEHPELQVILERHAAVKDERRPEKVAKIHARSRRTARENIADLVDVDSFVEYGPLVIAAQRQRRSLQDLIDNTSGDGIVGGIATINEGRFGATSTEVVVMSYDYMVMAGTQGHRNHKKTDRLLQVAAQRQLPVILFAEGGGGRPGDTESPPGAHLDNPTFASFAALKDVVPLIAVVSGRCFAGNAALAGVCDMIIATEDANLGMGGPAMIEGGGLGKYAPEDIGPVGVHMANGVIDLLVEDDAAAVSAVQTLLAYAQGATDTYTEPDPEISRRIVPADRHRAFNMRSVIDSIADVGSVIELRPGWADGAITAFIRVEGRPVAIIANNNHHLGGAIDAAAAQKFADFIRLADFYRVPIVSLIDSPGFMVGPEAEVDPGVKVFGQLFAAGAHASVPFGSIIIRKGYGLGAMAMSAGGFREPQFTVSWPAGEMGAMGLEGAVELGYRKELDAIDSPKDRERRFEELLAKEYDRGRAMMAAMLFDVDDIIDPADTRRWIRTLA